MHTVIGPGKPHRFKQQPLAQTHPFIDVPERWTANVTFGGEDRKTLFITAMDSLYSIRTRVRGAKPVVSK